MSFQFSYYEERVMVSYNSLQILFYRKCEDFKLFHVYM